jgi:hypothetical protein
MDVTSIMLAENLLINKAAAKQKAKLAIYKYLYEKAVRINSLTLKASEVDSL